MTTLTVSIHLLAKELGALLDLIPRNHWALSLYLLSSSRGVENISSLPAYPGWRVQSPKPNKWNISELDIEIEDGLNILYLYTYT